MADPFPPLEENCRECGGTGKAKEEPSGRAIIIGPNPCRACRGAKQLPTVAGKAVLEFVRKHMKAGTLR
ncbi:hypothetical protein ASE70_08080 [Sphingomonas sp. Leaf22]|uniref:hypothetical protein n=1 Tax=Sphingomonas sp. Leaf22 TaxID=1735687 RepID=UPI0006F9E40D|nr:hypothetical protein [Sphingomonas sp. Leaf22]KQM76720.1 hypothetical protein ASE70_08080 [Sphingomonas sp. Leaf22]